MTDSPEKPASQATRVDPRVNRRGFLRGAGIAAAAAVPMAADAEQLVQPTSHQAPARYQESEHVKFFYALNRR